MMDSPLAATDDDERSLFSSDLRLSVESDQEDVLGGLELPVALPSLDGVDVSLWNLISPCSDDGDEFEPLQEEDEDEDDNDDQEQEYNEAFEEIPIDHDDQTQHTEQQQPGALVELEEQKEHEESEREAPSSDDEDEEVEVFNAETAFRRSSSLESKAKDGSELLDSVTEADELDDLEVSSTTSSQLLFDDSTSEDGSVASHGVAPSAPWASRVKASTYSGTASVRMHQAYDKLRARTRSATASLRHASPPPPEDDGGFSSDDEDYDHERASRAPRLPRQTSFSFPTRLTAVKKNLQLPKKIPSMMRFRSSSGATTSSEDSYIGSADGSLHAETAKAPPKINAQELKHKASVCATRAAGLLGAASAEAARKLRTTRAFRSSSQPSMSRHVASSPIVDRSDESPSLPPRPRPTRSAGLASRSSE